jgi:metal-responsive CopG/Arc/MetJ family transcriptional regulator
MKHTNMSETGTEKTTVNVRMTETFLDAVDETWTDLGYNSRSEFVRDVLRDAIKHPDFNRADWKAIAAGEIEIREGETHASEDVKAAFDLE